MIESASDGRLLSVVLSEGGGVYAARRFGLEGSAVRAVVCPETRRVRCLEKGAGRFVFYD